MTTPDGRRVIEGEPRGIEARGLGLLTSSGWVYRDVDLCVPAGSVALVSGPAGCGKTALLLTLAARMLPSAGALRLGDCDAVAQPQRARRFVGLGETSGVNELDVTLTVGDQVRAELALHGKRRARTDVALALAPVGLALDARVKIGDLHAADRLLLGVALALIGTPPSSWSTTFTKTSRRPTTRSPWRGCASSPRGGLTIVAGSLDPSLAAHADVVLWLDADGRPPSGRRRFHAPLPSPRPARRPTVRSFRLAQSELKRLLSARAFRIAAGVVCVVPLLYAVLYLWAFWDPYSRLDKLPVAVVNLDQPVRSAGVTVHVGADLMSQLRTDKSFEWLPVSAARARTGLRSGRYAMTLIIPADFSAHVASASSARPQAATLQVQANEAHNLLATQIGGRIFVELRASLSAVTAKGYLSHIFVGLSDVKRGTSKAAGGAGT